MGKWELVSSMQPLFESWRAFMTEGNDIYPFQLYVDLDGVLVDFQRGATEAMMVKRNAGLGGLVVSSTHLGASPMIQVDLALGGFHTDPTQPSALSFLSQQMVVSTEVLVCLCTVACKTVLIRAACYPPNPDQTFRHLIEAIPKHARPDC